MHRNFLAGMLAAVLTVGMSLPALSLGGGEGCIMSRTQILIGNADLSTRNDRLENAKKKSKPNTVEHLNTIAAGQVSKLDITAERCGVVIERSNTGSFEIALVGADKKENLQVSAKAAGDTLTLKAKGAKALTYMNTAPDFRVNCVVLRVPKALYASQKLKVNGLGIISTQAVAKSVTGQSERGMIRIDDETISQTYKLETEQGSVAVSGNTINGSIDLSTKNGSVAVETGDEAGGTVSGTLRAKSENGSVFVTAGRLGGADLKSENGSVVVKAGELTGDTSVEVSNGSIWINLQRAVNLRAVFSHGWGELTLPSGWSADTVLGNGTPKLTVRGGNGDIEMSLGKSRNEYY